MEKKSIYFLIKDHWREFLIVFCICFGIGLIYSTKHLFQVFSELLVVNPYASTEVECQSTDTTLQALNPEPEKYQIFLPIVSSNQQEEEQARSDEQQIEKSTDVEPENHFLDIDFKDGSKLVTIVIDPAIEQSHAKTPVKITFQPGDECVFGDGHACIYEFLGTAGNRIIMISVHSGLGGEAEEFRNLLEGTGINQGLFEPGQVLNNAQSLSGSKVKIKQAEKKMDGLVLAAVVRIPPENYKIYTSLPIEEALDYVVKITSLDPAILNKDLFIIETCGWHLPGEMHVEGLSDTSNSVYLGFVSYIGD